MDAQYFENPEFRIVKYNWYLLPRFNFGLLRITEAFGANGLDILVVPNNFGFARTGILEVTNFGIKQLLAFSLTLFSFNTFFSFTVFTLFSSSKTKPQNN